MTATLTYTLILGAIFAGRKAMKIVSSYSSQEQH
jgi:hypothetical protein